MKKNILAVSILLGLSNFAFANGYIVDLKERKIPVQTNAKIYMVKEEEVNFTTQDYSMEEIKNIKKSFSSMLLDPTLVKSEEDDKGLYLVNYSDHIPNFAIYLRTWDKANKEMVVITPFY